MKCPRCQAQNQDGTRFCEDCGARLEQACPSCGQPITPEKKFCRSCGASLASDSGQSASPASYAPRHLAEQILTANSTFPGERKQVTVLFADLKGLLELLADRDPEEARHVLDAVLERMIEPVHRYEGTVNNVMGDGIMALFGAPLAHEDHAARACDAALEMQESVKHYAEGMRREHGVMIRIRVGLNSGEVVVRAISPDLHMDYTAVGDTVTVARHLQEAAEPGTVLIGEGTNRGVQGVARVESTEPLRVEGRSNPIVTYRLVGMTR